MTTDNLDTNIVINSLSNNLLTNNCYKLIDLSLIGLSIGGIGFGITQYLIDETLTGWGFTGMGILASINLVILKKMRLQAVLQKSVNTLKEENDELKDNNDKLSKTVTDLENIKLIIDDDLKLLKETIGLADENADELIEKLRTIHNKLKNENDRHSLLVKSQASLQIMNIFNHFDKDHNLVLDEKELKYAKESILIVLPNLEWQDIKSKIENKTLKVQHLLELL